MKTLKRNKRATGTRVYNRCPLYFYRGKYCFILMHVQISNIRQKPGRTTLRCHVRLRRGFICWMPDNADGM